MPKASWVLSVAAVFLAVLTAGCSTSPRVYGESITQEQRFVLTDVDGQRVRMDDLLANNKVVLLNFWATWCPYCQREIPELMALQDRYRSAGFSVVGIDIGESAAKVKAYADNKQINYPLLLDRDNSVAGAYEVVGVPTSYLIRSDGKILGAFNTLTSGVIREIEKAIQ
jgi:peroxiredoxin